MNEVAWYILTEEGTQVQEQRAVQMRILGSALACTGQTGEHEKKQDVVKQVVVQSAPELCRMPCRIMLLYVQVETVCISFATCARLL